MNSDWENLRAAQKGDRKSFDHLYEKYGSNILSMAVLITGSHDTAKDIVQETYVKLLDAKIKNDCGNFKSYITTISYRLALKENYRKKKLGDIDNYEFYDAGSSPEIEHIKREDQLNIFKAINSLPENQKNILVLRFYGSLSYEEISQIESLPLGTVKSRIFYAAKACREKLKSKGVFE